MERQIQSYLRQTATRSRMVLHPGHFLATFTSHSSNPFLNYAIPDEEASPSPEEIASLINVYLHRDRIPRLEYLSHLAPAVEPALTSCGFHVEERLPLMICEPGYLRVSSLASGIDLLTPTTDDDLFTLIAVQNEAYGDMLPRPEVVKRQRAFLRAGGIALLVRDQVTGETVGGGICDVPFDRTTELSSVGVRPPWLAADRRSARYSFPEYHDGKDRLRAISRERGSIKKYRVQPGEKQRKP